MTHTHDTSKHTHPHAHAHMPKNNTHMCIYACTYTSIHTYTSTCTYTPPHLLPFLYAHRVVVDVLRRREIRGMYRRDRSTPRQTISIGIHSSITSHPVTPHDIIWTYTYMHMHVRMYIHHLHPSAHAHAHDTCTCACVAYVRRIVSMHRSSQVQARWRT